MKEGLIFLGLFFVFASVQFASGLRINEVNPYGNEYIEIYNDGESVDLSSWKITDNSGQTDTIKCGGGCITNEKYFLIIGSSADLSKFSGKVFLVDDQRIGNGLNDNGDRIEIETSEEKLSMEYGKISSGKSWNFCDGKFGDGKPTANSENECSSTQIDVNSLEDEVKSAGSDESVVTGKKVITEKSDTTSNEDAPNEIQKTDSEDSINAEVIKLENTEQQTIKTEVYESNISKISRYSVFIFIGLSIVIFGVYVLRRIKYG